SFTKTHTYLNQERRTNLLSSVFPFLLSGSLVPSLSTSPIFSSFQNLHLNSTTYSDMAHHHHHHHHSHQQQQKQLFQLLQDDQEPFILNNYIADHYQLTRTKPKRTKPACFFPITNSPASAVADPRKSPLYFPKSPVAAKTRPTKSRVHSKTASLLLEAAIRVTHKTQSSSSRGGKIGAGIFGSLLKRLGTNNKKSKKEGFDDVKVSVKDILRQEDVRKRSNSNSVSPTRNAVRCGGCESGPSSAVWSSESNESIDLDLGCHSSSSGGGGFLSEEEEEIEFVNQVVDFASYDDDKQYCESPFRFTLERSLSSSTAGRRTPEFSSPVASPPVCFKTEGNEKTRDVEIEEEEEEKEQCSPVSVLDPPFEDDDDVEREEDDDGGFDMECSFAFVQSTYNTTSSSVLHMWFKTCLFSCLNWC
ncbi:hypothetical protein LINPERPRIM_LOCUS15830, partial [Linum perenne]